MYNVLDFKFCDQLCIFCGGNLYLLYAKERRFDCSVEIDAFECKGEY